MADRSRDQAEVLDRVLRKHWANAHVPTQLTPLEELIAGEEREDVEDDEELADLRREVRFETFDRMLAYFFQRGPDPLEVLRMVFSLAKAVRPKLIGDMSLEDISIICAEGGKATVSARIKRIYNDKLEEQGQTAVASSFQKRGNYAQAQRGNQNRKKNKGRD